MKGLFVTFEGGEGSGKSTQISRLANRLQALGHDVLMTREPGGTPLAEGIRALLMDPQARPHPMAEAFLMEAARADLVDKVIKPALESGSIVLCDRYVHSTMAYQGAGRGLPLADLEAWNRAATSGLMPDVTFLFDLDPEIGTQRRLAAGAPNRFDRESLEFHRHVREGYLNLANSPGSNIVVLDAAQPPEEVEQLIWGVVDTLWTYRRTSPPPCGGSVEGTK